MKKTNPKKIIFDLANSELADYTILECGIITIIEYKSSDNGLYALFIINEKNKYVEWINTEERNLLTRSTYEEFEKIFSSQIGE